MKELSHIQVILFISQQLRLVITNDIHKIEPWFTSFIHKLKTKLSISYMQELNHSLDRATIHHFQNGASSEIITKAWEFFLNIGIK